MRAIKAKKIRRKIYGDMSIRERDYIQDGGTRINNPNSLRAQYKKAKKVS